MVALVAAVSTAMALAHQAPQVLLLLAQVYLLVAVAALAVRRDQQLFPMLAVLRGLMAAAAADR